MSLVVITSLIGSHDNVLARHIGPFAHVSGDATSCLAYAFASYTSSSLSSALIFAFIFFFILVIINRYCLFLCPTASPPSRFGFQFFLLVHPSGLKFFFIFYQRFVCGVSQRTVCGVFQRTVFVFVCPPKALHPMILLCSPIWY